MRFQDGFGLVSDSFVWPLVVSQFIRPLNRIQKLYKMLVDQSSVARMRVVSSLMSIAKTSVEYQKFLIPFQQYTSQSKAYAVVLV